MTSIEQILLEKAQADREKRIDPGVAMGGGAAVGGTLGLLAKPNWMPGGSRLRLAGGLMGTILGGGLGLGVRQLMVNESPAARALAVMQTQGQLDPTDRAAVQSVLRDIYSNGM